MFAGALGSGGAFFLGERMNERRVRRREKHRRTTISSLLLKIEERADELKPTVVDYIRLMQLERELEGAEQPREVRGSWEKPRGGSGTGE
jgi:hypothetical protein